MKSRFTHLCVLAAAWMILGSSMPAHKSKSPAAKQTMYYWYWTDNDTYLNYNTTANEITDLQNSTGYLVNTQQAGGMLFANGYNNNNFPHNSVPVIRLYGH
jgi:hypothetical protein